MHYNLTSATAETKSSAACVPLAVPPREGCRLLSVSPATLYSLLRTGELESFNIGRARRISTQSISDFISRQIAARGDAVVSPGKARKASSQSAPATAAA
jgi:excisionase family DNA binding protein